MQLVAGGPVPRGACQGLAPRSPCLVRFSSACFVPFLCLSFGALLPQRRGLGFRGGVISDMTAARRAGASTYQKPTFFVLVLSGWGGHSMFV